MKGPTPCLIGTTLGSCRFVQPGGRGPLRHCNRCNAELSRDRNCVEVTIPGTLGHKTFCPNCFSNILDATQAKVNSLRTELKSIEDS